MVGEIALWTTLLFALGGVLGGWFPSAAHRRLATAAAFLSFFGALTASGALLFFILTDRFDIAYVANYSAKELPLLYKVSAFWAGQAGSFLFWLFVSAGKASLSFRPWGLHGAPSRSHSVRHGAKPLSLSGDGGVERRWP
mgnify:CR=1 FL=1